jgi:hypothetical protein
MTKKIKELLDTLQQELTDGYNTKDMGYIDMAQCTLYELEKELEKELDNG